MPPLCFFFFSPALRPCLLPMAPPEGNWGKVLTCCAKSECPSRHMSVFKRCLFRGICPGAGRGGGGGGGPLVLGGPVPKFPFSFLMICVLLRGLATGCFCSFLPSCTESLDRLAVVILTYPFHLCYLCLGIQKDKCFPVMYAYMLHTSTSRK